MRVWLGAARQIGENPAPEFAKLRDGPKGGYCELCMVNAPDAAGGGYRECFAEN
jgi:hypothetical protein